MVARGTHEEDGPVNWEVLATPTRKTGEMGHRRSIPNEGAVVTARATRKKKKAVTGGVGRKRGEPELKPKVARKSEDCIRAKKAGNGWHPDPAEQRQSVLERTFRRAP